MSHCLRSSFAFFAILTSLGAAACSSSDGTPSGSSSSTSGGSSTSSSGGNGSCPGDIASCAVGSLSTAQQDDLCSVLATAVDDPPGTKFECKGGPQDGAFVSVNSKADCVAKPAPKTCKVTVSQLVACYKGAKADACAAFASGGACSALLDPSSGCGG